MCYYHSAMNTVYGATVLINPWQMLTGVFVMSTTREYNANVRNLLLMKTKIQEQRLLYCVHRPQMLDNYTINMSTLMGISRAVKQLYINHTEWRLHAVKLSSWSMIWHILLKIYILETFWDNVDVVMIAPHIWISFYTSCGHTYQFRDLLMFF